MKYTRQKPNGVSKRTEYEREQKGGAKREKSLNLNCRNLVLVPGHGRGLRGESTSKREHFSV